MCYHLVEILIVHSTQSSKNSVRERRHSDLLAAMLFLGLIVPRRLKNVPTRVIFTSMTVRGPLAPRNIPGVGLLAGCVAADSISTPLSNFCDRRFGEPKSATRSTCGANGRPVMWYGPDDMQIVHSTQSSKNPARER